MCFRKRVVLKAMCEKRKDGEKQDDGKLFFFIDGAFS